jgi:hypothetical protein
VPIDHNPACQADFHSAVAASLLQAYTRVLAEAKPRAFILENVYALIYKNKAQPTRLRALAP